jgi:transcription-repair coupling factor (superfamily II helicase)
MILPFVREMLAELEKTPSFERVRTHLRSASGRRRVSGLSAAARALHIPLFARAAQSPLIIIVSDNKQAEALQLAVQSACELTGLVKAESVVRLPAHDVLPFEEISPHPDIEEQRAVALWKATSGDAQILIAPIEAASMRLFPAEYYAGLARSIKRGEEIDLEPLLAHLNTVGYAGTDVVEMPGQYARRGGILDVYSPEMDRPVRIEFFGDEVESLRKFDPETQRSQAPMDEAILLPLTETPATEKLLTAVHARLRSGRVEADDAAQEQAASDMGAGIFPGWEFFAGLAGADRMLFDLLPRAQVLIEEPAMVANQQERWWSKLEQRHERSGTRELVRPEEIYFPPEEWRSMLALLPGMDLDQLGAVDILDDDVASVTSEIEFHSRPTPHFHGSIPALVDELKARALAGERTLLTAPTQGEVERLADMLQEYGLSYRVGSRQTGASGTVYDESAHIAGELTTPVIVRLPMAVGVSFPDAKFSIFGANDLSDEADVAARPVRPRSKTSAFVSDFRDLAVGDYVVHVEHGISRYQGLREIIQDGTPIEFMVLEFAEGARMYVPLTRLDLIQKYRSTETGAAPPLNRLGTQQWAKTKARVKKTMQEMADELLKLYALRAAAEGNAFSPDNNLQHEFEDAFDFAETTDQIAAIADIKRDMESQQPMDRLLCGDVGYGKTEVAMRAALKAVQDSKQVALLAPTTVLTFQHFETFKRRFANFPVNIEMISRFRTPKEQKAILEKVEHGKVDILIGTHRLLSKDVKFQDLGLLIVDEEQRFGVRHKERLKQLRTHLDVLTMSATPIPRTLHMGLVGLRDMSLIETPPKDRMAIQTLVAKYDEKIVRSAIELELERGGQVYFVHNRVETIFEIAAKVQELVPTARVGVGHGQMNETELERVMLAFMRHEFDVLIATTIIENGLDIPLANTILINRADRHGLSELYQLRGRVGRSNRRAYAYLLVPPDQELTDIARRRLAALKEFSDLGAGFKIAALDLELRGAGNLLGGEQSGQIESVGFELYTRMLEQAVHELKGGSAEERVSVHLNLGISLRIDADYIAEENQRLRMYKRIAGAESEAALSDVRAELADRYGAIPTTVEHLLIAGQLRLECERAGVVQMDRKRDSLQLRFAENAKVDPERLMQLVARNEKRGARFTPEGVLKFPLRGQKPDEVLAEARALLEQLAWQETLA